MSRIIKKVIKHEQDFIDELIKFNKQPITSLVDSYNRTWINVFIAQSYYFMAVLEKKLFISENRKK